jgi:hypothetical protein
MDAFAEHLHWVQTGKATWRLHRARVRQRPAHYRGAMVLSYQTCYVRRLASGGLKYGFKNKDFFSRMKEKLMVEGGWLPDARDSERRIEEAFLAFVAETTLRGDKRERVGVFPYAGQKPCECCPPEAHEWYRRARGRDPSLRNEKFLGG